MGMLICTFGMSLTETDPSADSDERPGRLCNYAFRLRCYWDQEGLH
jgi:hypothetical protein